MQMRQRPEHLRGIKGLGYTCSHVDYPEFTFLITNPADHPDGPVTALCWNCLRSHLRTGLTYQVRAMRPY